jgi:aspartyl aminopeptidase
MLSFLSRSVTPFHAAENVTTALVEAGFAELAETDEFSLQPGAAYFVRRGDSSVIAFRLGTEPVWRTGFAVAGAHTDSPALRLKYPAASETEGYRVVPVEVYGGPIRSTWIDRSLGVAGRLIVREGTRLESRLIDSGEAIAVIPNAAVHLNREVNKGFEYNPQDHLQAIFGSSEFDFEKRLAESAGVEAKAIVDADLYFYDVQAPSRFGAHGELYCAGRIDNLAGCFAILDALSTSEPTSHTQVGCFFDNEEIGSRTPQGADSAFLTTILDRIVLASGGTSEQAYAARARSFLLSNDGAHAVHPSYASKHDPSFKPALNGGPVIKISARRRYTSDASSSAKFVALCEAEDVPYQRFYNRSDARSGSTIGPIASSLSSVSSVDVGVPMLAMHSVREVAGVRDAEYTSRVTARFYAEGPSQAE